MSTFQGVARVKEHLAKHHADDRVYPSENFNEETKKIDGANKFMKELTSQNVLETLAHTAPDLAAGLEKVEELELSVFWVPPVITLDWELTCSSLLESEKREICRNLMS